MKKVALALAGLALISAPAFADNTDTQTVNVSGTIIAPLTITGTTTLTMPHIVKPTATLSSGGASPSTGTGTVQVACSSGGVTTVTYSAGVNPFAHGASGAPAVDTNSANRVPATAVGYTGICAGVTVTGQSGYFFLTVAGAGTSPTTGVTIPATACSPAAANTVLTSGTATVYCGATVQVTSSASTGAYTGTFPVTVTYD